MMRTVIQLLLIQVTSIIVVLVTSAFQFKYKSLPNLNVVINIYLYCGHNHIF